MFQRDLLFSAICLAFTSLVSSVPVEHIALDENESISSRIVGGIYSDIRQFPYQISLKTSRGSHYCGGAIIDKYWVITAAHCVSRPDLGLTIITGTTNVTRPDCVYQISELKIHPFHSKGKYFNDIALIRVDKPIEFNNDTQPIQLATINDLKNGDELHIPGWGSTQLNRKGSIRLKSLSVRYLEKSSCIARIPSKATLSKENLCFVSPQGSGACFGDSGGPVVNENGILYGVLNWGIPCAKGYPDVFTNIAYYYPWIKRTIKSFYRFKGD